METGRVKVVSRSGIFASPITIVTTGPRRRNAFSLFIRPDPFRRPFALLLSDFFECEALCCQQRHRTLHDSAPRKTGS